MKKIRIMVIDGNSDFRDSVRECFFDNNEIELVCEAADGLDGLAKIDSYKPNVVIMDVILPKYDGFSVLKEIKRYGSDAPKIIVASDFCSADFIKKAIYLGASYYLAKPVDFAALPERIKEFCCREHSNETVETQSDKYVELTKKKAAHSLDDRLSNIFITIGIPAHIKGYQFLKEAIRLAIGNSQYVNNITKKLYPTVAQRFTTSSSKVERAIRHAIEVAWNRGKIDNLNAIFGIKIYSANDKPTNGEFIALLADKLYMEGF